MKMKSVARLVLLAMLSLPALQEAHAVEPIEWQSRPIKIPLQVGEQRLIHFPDHVVFGRPKSLSDKLDQNISLEKTYMKVMTLLSMQLLMV